MGRKQGGALLCPLEPFEDFLLRCSLVLPLSPPTLSPTGFVGTSRPLWAQLPSVQGGPSSSSGHPVKKLKSFACGEESEAMQLRPVVLTRFKADWTGILDQFRTKEGLGRWKQLFALACAWPTLTKVRAGAGVGAGSARGGPRARLQPPAHARGGAAAPAFARRCPLPGPD